MNVARRPWNREELIVAFNLYCKIPFARIHYTREEIVDLAHLLHRTPSAVALKLVNFARLDPKLQARKILGMRHGSKEELVVWNQFHENWEELAYESEVALAQLKGLSILESLDLTEASLWREGKTRDQLVKMRVNQGFFRAVVLASYSNRCCISGIPIPELLVASHIVPWSIDEVNRMNPANGLCLNLLLDKAYDRGLITISTDYSLKLSKVLLKQKKNAAVQSFFLPYENQPIRLPNRFLPDPVFLEYHNNVIFQKG